jgi:outer membrane protein W
MHVLFGLRYDFLQTHSASFLQPYLSSGIGGYVFDDVKVVNQIGINEVETTTKVKPGFYLGGGLNIQLASWVALNLDGKYHFINANPNYDHSGFEFGIGFNFSWGEF